MECAGRGPDSEARQNEMGPEAAAAPTCWAREADRGAHACFSFTRGLRLPVHASA